MNWDGKSVGIGNQKVSVIIPVYNRERTMRQCMRSVLDQDYPNYEVIVVDGNSSDGTLEIINDFMGRSGKVRLLSEPRSGIGAARHAGERAAEGGIILMTDSDCILPRYWISEMIEPILKGGQVAVQGIKRNATVNYWTGHVENEEKIIFSMRRKDKKIGLLDTANFAIKRSVLRDVGYTSRKIPIGNDTELNVRLKMRGYEIHTKPVPVLHHHPKTGKGLFKKLFIRGAWDWKIRRMYRDRKELFSNVSPMDHLRFLTGLSMEFLTMRDSFRFDMITGIAWRIGAVYARLNDREG